MSLKLKLIEKIFESKDISVDDKIDIIKELKDTTEEIIESTLLEIAVNEMSPVNKIFFNKKFDTLVAKIMKSRKISKEAAVKEIERIMGGSKIK